MVSFELESLFTNIPLDETINICVDRLYTRKKKVRGLLKRHFKQLLTLATKSSCFLFNGVYYSQLDGVAMGSPLGPTLANLFLAYHEEKWLNDCPVQFKPHVSKQKPSAEVSTLHELTPSEHQIHSRRRRKWFVIIP